LRPAPGHPWAQAALDFSIEKTHASREEAMAAMGSWGKMMENWEKTYLPIPSGYLT